jgi:hypothetical protein
MRFIMRPSLLRSLSPFLLAAGMLVAGPARAQGGDQSAIAEDLFRQAKALMEQKKFKEACEKFEGSQRLDPSTGTLLNLADCNEKQGKLASAWAQFGEAAVLAKRAGTADRATVAQDRAKALEARLSRVRLVVPDNVRTPGLQVFRDDIALDPAIWNGLAATDAGKHVFRATAPGKLEWKTTVDVQGEGKATDVTVPPLAAAPVEAKPEVKPAASAEPVTAPPPPPPGPPPANNQRTAGFVVGGLGVAGLAVGGIFGGLASSQWSKAKDKCPANLCIDQAAQDDAKGAKTKATISTAGFVAGGVLLAVGVTIVLVSPDSSAPAQAAAPFRRPTLAVAPTAGPGAAGFDLVGSF